MMSGKDAGKLNNENKTVPKRFAAAHAAPQTLNCLDLDFSSAIRTFYAERGGSHCAGMTHFMVALITPERHTRVALIASECQHQGWLLLPE